MMTNAHSLITKSFLFPYSRKGMTLLTFCIMKCRAFSSEFSRRPWELAYVFNEGKLTIQSNMQKMHNANFNKPVRLSTHSSVVAKNATTEDYSVVRQKGNKQVKDEGINNE